MIKKDFVTPSTGAVAAVHVVTQVQIDYAGSNLTTATVSSFLSDEAYAAGKWALYTQAIPIEGLPAAAQDPRNYAEDKLVEAMPDGQVTAYANRYAFAGGEIVATPA
ncbi:hypothetical protein [Caballeronia cordobensis]|uniref:hypothetical protein n=1 Tax=Caballeronia cordobensis TaxID=1353886 RepID=UPI00045F0C7E|nr:putative uncharacterized protein [Burkholderia sp. RPE67]